jgi:acetyltransferase-like isoleucine patch superfamily enzyme
MFLNFIKKNIKWLITKRRFRHARIYGGVVVCQNTNLGENVVLFENTCLIKSTVGAYSYVQKNSTIVNTDIGKFCSISSNVHLGVVDHPSHFISTSPVFYDNEKPLPQFFVNQNNNLKITKATAIAHDVWIGQSVIVKSGVTIGTGAIIGAGAIVVKDVAPYSIVSGVPAKLVKWRFEESVRNGLLLSKWWNLPSCDLILLSDKFDDPKAFLKEVMG